ncbi:MAG: DUF2971 domain-containing protein [Rhodospirillales bacterium]|nr:DUF2971 domain-containing protein [Rhodospirillales bacterium]
MKQLFKYMPQPWDVFRGGFIRLTQISVLNDPFEGFYCRNGMEALTKHFNDQSVLPDLKYSDYVNRELKNVGIISLSENKENLLMWAHYANEHKGLVAGIIHVPEFDQNIFDNLLSAEHLFLTGSGMGPIMFDGVPKPVSYRKTARFRNDLFDYDYSYESGDLLLVQTCMQKSDDWLHEQEHRIVLRLEQSDLVIAPKELIAAALGSGSPPFLQRLVKSKETSLSTDLKRYVINLSEIEDETDRIVYSKFLAGLSEHRDVIYLMKLSASAINNCIFGLNSNMTKQDFEASYARKTGNLDFWQARKCIDHYGLEFEEL